MLLAARRDISGTASIPSSHPRPRRERDGTAGCPLSTLPPGSTAGAGVISKQNLPRQVQRSSLGSFRLQAARSPDDSFRVGAS